MKHGRIRLTAVFSHFFLTATVAATILELLLLPRFTWAQESPGQAASAYAGQTISLVDVAGRPDVTYQSVQNLIPVKHGQPLEQKDVDAAIAVLRQRTGIQDIALDLQPVADGVRVVFVLRPAVYVGMYEFPGALNEFSYPRLLQVANYNPQTPYSASDVQHAEDAIVQFFRQEGYFLAEVRPEIERLGDSGLVNVVFHTNLG